jgi:hypothetical protein
MTARTLGVGVAIVVATLALHRQPPADATTALTARVTTYIESGVTYSGEWTYVGGAACSWNFPLGSIFALPDGTQVRCNDRGLLYHDPSVEDGWIDIYAPSWEYARWLWAQWSPRTTVTVVQWGP